MELEKVFVSAHTLAYLLRYLKENDVQSKHEPQFVKLDPELLQLYESL